MVNSLTLIPPAPKHPVINARYLKYKILSGCIGRATITPYLLHRDLKRLKKRVVNHRFFISVIGLENEQYHKGVIYFMFDQNKHVLNYIP